MSKRSMRLTSRDVFVYAIVFLNHVFSGKKFGWEARKIIFLIFFLLCSAARGQNKASGPQIVSVGLNTGTPHVSIPVYTVFHGGVSVPVSLEYDAGGLRIGEIEGLIGSGWNLNAGGAITRMLRDLPDDIKADQSGNSRTGWLYNSNASLIKNFNIANDNNSATCSDENTDINYLNIVVPSNTDIEPDIFNVQAPGLNCRLVYDQANSVFRTIPYQDLQVSYSLNAAQNSIASFTITNNKGLTYSFTVSESMTQNSTSSNPANIVLFKRDYNLYQYGIVYNTKWYLSKIQDPAGNYISLTYSNNSVTRTYSSPIHVYFTNFSGLSTDSVLYYINQTNYPEFVTSIASYNKLNGQSVDSLSLSYTSTSDIAGSIVSAINLNKGSRTMTCGYRKQPGRTRDFLTSFGETGCSSGSVNYNANLYSFTYSQVDFTNNPPIIPDYSTNAANEDYWGFFNNNNDMIGNTVYAYPDNASYPNLERYRLYPISGYTGATYVLGQNGYSPADPSMMAGTLSQITYPTGGNTSFVYEYNDFYDVSAAATFQGGGFRVKQIIDYDGINTTNNIVRNYTYTDPVTSVTTGKPIAMPAVAVTIPYTGTQTGLNYWNASTIRLPPGYSNQDESIIYGKVTVQQPGAGKQVYTFTNPGTFWDLSASPDWVPTIDYAGRPMNSNGSCPASGSIKNATFSYPFAPNINYEFERGLPTSIISYNESGNIVSQTTYTYQRTSAPVAITALKFDNNNNATNYAKYQIYCGTSELITNETKYVNDLSNNTNNTATRISNSVNYYYQGLNHKLPTKIETVNTDGSTNRTYITYVKDYTYQVDDVYDQPMGAIKALAAMNVNSPIEKYYTVTRSSVEKTMRAELVKFASFPGGTTSPANIYLPAQQLSFISSAGITGFTPSYNNSGTFTSYAGYLPVANYTAYNSFGSLLSGNDNYRNVKSQIIDDNHLLPIASIKNANYNEISYSNFDGSEPKYGVSVNAATYNSATSRSGVNCLALSPSVWLTDTLNVKQNSKNYVLSYWINASASSSLNLYIYNSSGTLLGTQALNFSSNGSGWTYYEQKINVSSLSGTFSFRITTNSTINIDDLLFYPEDAEVGTASYMKNTFLKSSETNTNGVSQYYAYDQFYRLQYVYDQDMNIIEKKTYASVNNNNGWVGAQTISASPSVASNIGTTISFTGPSSNSCIAGTFYSYNFGDGTGTTPSLTGANATHSYSTAGTYTVICTATNPLFGSTTTSTSVTALMIPQYCQSGVWGFTAPSTIYTQPCSPNPDDAAHSYFTINSITGLPTGHTVSYQWQIAYTATGSACGSASWTNTGTNSYQLSTSLNTGSFCPYNIRCIVTDVTNGQQVIVNVGSVEAGSM